MVGLSSAMGDLLVAGSVLAVTLLAGILAHESTHAAVLHAFGIRYDVAWLPERRATGIDLASPIMTVTPKPGSEPCHRAVRVAAIAPLVLMAPLSLVVTGLVPDPFVVGDPFMVAATVGWAACALPSPQDFGVFWHGVSTPE
jgi:hypothetical protein